MQRRAACTALGWASTRWTTVTSASTPHRRLLPPLSTALRRCLATATSPPPPPSSSAPNGNTKPAPLPSPSSSTSASSPLSGEGDEAFVCPPPLSRYFSPIAPDPALFRRYVQCLGQRVPDPSLPPLPSSVHVRPASSSSATSQPLISKDQEIFANQDCPLQHILWWGFDYDYTLASYNDQLGYLIYEEAKQYLIHRLGYPRELGRCAYEPRFAIRGLHFDDRTGFLLKLDQFGKVQLETVHKGRQKVGVDEIVSRYNGITINKEYEEQHLHLMADLFCLPEICLLADTIQAFLDSSDDFSPDYVYRDVFRAIEYTHTSGKLHDAIIAQPSKYLEPNPEMRELLDKLRKAGKKVDSAHQQPIFLLTNSNFNFVDAGMRHMLDLPPPPPKPVLHPPPEPASKPLSSSSSSSSSSSASSSWLDLFDVCIFSARKPRFWQRKSSNFRLIDQRTGALSFRPVSGFLRGEAYTEGSLEEFERLTGAAASNVIYSGDNTAADLVTPSESGLWKTVAIMKGRLPAVVLALRHQPLPATADADAAVILSVPLCLCRSCAELSHEARVMQSLPFRRSLRRLLEVEALIDFGQRLEDAASRELIEELKKRRKGFKRTLLSMFNPHFGSAFRTASHRTKLFFEVSRYADVYTSSIANFLRYPLSYCFYAKRSFFPHEVQYELIMATEDAEEAMSRAAAEEIRGAAAGVSPSEESKEVQTGRGSTTSAVEADAGEHRNPLQREDASEAEKREQLGQ